MPSILTQSNYEQSLVNLARERFKELEEIVTDPSSDEEYGSDSQLVNEELERTTLSNATRWVNSNLKNIDFSKFEKDAEFVDYVNSSPFRDSGHMLHSILCILATRDVGHVGQFLGLPNLRVTEYILLFRCVHDFSHTGHTRRCVSTYCEMIIRRGNVAGRKEDRMKTNRCYLWRQSNFLDFLQTHPRLQTSYEDLAKRMQRTPEEAEQFIDRFEGRVLLVTVESFIEFMKFKDEAKRLKFEKSSTNGFLSSQKTSLIDLNEIGQQWSINQSSQCVIPPRKKHKRRKNSQQIKPYVRMSDFNSYKNAIAELHSQQHKFLASDAFVSEIKRDASFKNFVKTKTSKIRGMELLDSTDKCSNTISSNPTTTKIEELMEHWMLRGCGTDSFQCYLGLTNCAIFTNMLRGGLNRADNCHRLKYSDIEYRSLYDMATTRRGRINVPLFLQRQNESKTNKNNNMVYTCKVPHHNVFDCGLVYEGMLLAYRHDLLNVRPNHFSQAINVPGCPVHRTWYQDSFYCQLNMKKKTLGRRGSYSFQGKEYSGVCMAMKTSYSLELLSSDWRKSYANLDVNCSHTLHLPRSWGAMAINMDGIEFHEIARLGHWAQSYDTLTLSYTTLPNIDTICRVSGGCSLDTYLPHWIALEPPRQLVYCILLEYHTKLREIQKNIEMAKTCEDNGFSHMAWDNQALQTCLYITQLAKIVVQAAPFISQKYPKHDFVKRHHLFHHKLFQKWKNLMLQFTKLLEQLETKTPILLQDVNNCKLITTIQDNSISICPSNEGRLKSNERSGFVLGSLCSFLEQLINEDATTTDSSVTFHDHISKLIQGTLYNDLKQDMTMIKDLLHSFVTKSTNREQMNILKRNHSETEALHDQLEETNGQRIEIRNLPMLSILDQRANPIREVVNVWTHEMNGQRALCDVFESTREGYIKFDPKARGAKTTACRIRMIFCILKLISPNLDDAVNSLQNYCNEHQLSLRALVTQIQTDLTRNGLSKKGVFRGPKDILKDSKYPGSDCFWKHISP